MKKYFLALLLVSSAHANVDDDIDITPILQKYAAANPVQPLPTVIAPIEYDLPESKWGKPDFYQTTGKCQMPMHLMEQCKSPLRLKYERLQNALKAKANAKRELVKNEYRNRSKAH
jgi:hypothetical protein